MSPLSDPRRTSPAPRHSMRGRWLSLRRPQASWSNSVIQISLASLDEALTRIRQPVNDQYPDAGLWVDVKTGRLVVTGPTPVRSDDLKAMSDLARVPIRQDLEPAASLLHTYGGKRMFNAEGGCTSGFTVVDAVSGLTGVLSAGHCFTTDATYVQDATTSYNADLSGRPWDANQDFEWFQTSHEEFAQFFDGAVLRNQTGTQPRAQMVGNPVCHYGISTGQSCGIVDTIHFNPSPTYCNGGPCDAVWVKVSGPALRCFFGDSGGPMYWGSTAWGTVSGGIPVGGGAGCTYLIMMSVGALQWDGVNTRILLP